MTAILPILFSAPMVRALLAGKKTQTRRALNPQPSSGVRVSPFAAGGLEDGHGRRVALRYYPGDVLWVREAWQFARQKYCSCPQGSEPSPCDDWSNGVGCRSARDGIIFRCDGGQAALWRPSTHMPRWASRLTLAVTEVRVQRVQEISKADVIAEGITERDGYPIDECHAGWHEPFAKLWDSINGKRHGLGWDDNPWVVALTFAVHHTNVDQYLAMTPPPTP